MPRLFTSRLARIRLLPPDRPALALWIGSQLALLAITLLRLPLSAEGQIVQQSMELKVLAVGQVSITALLAPTLLVRVSTSLVVAASVWPAQFLCAGLLMRSLTETVTSATFLTGLIILLSTWMGCLSTARKRAFIATVLVFLCVGLPTLHYLTADFARLEEATKANVPLRSLTTLFECASGVPTERVSAQLLAVYTGCLAGAPIVRRVEIWMRNCVSGDQRMSTSSRAEA